MSGDLFPGQHADEKIIFFFQKHWVELVYPIGRFAIEQFIILMVVLFMFFRGQALAHTMEGRIMVCVVILALIATVCTFWIRVFNYFLRVVIVTDYRLIDVKQKLFITTNEEIIDMREVQNIKAETRGFFLHLFKCGNLTFVTATGVPKILHNVPKPALISAKIAEVREIYRKLGTVETEKIAEK